MPHLSFNSFISSEFLQQTYAQFIKNHILNRPNLSDDQLTQLLQEIEPKLDGIKLKEILQTTIRCNAGITPCLVRENGSLNYVGAHSQRKGEGARGVLVSATGLIEEQDKTLMDGALRELNEELGPHLYNACSPNISLALTELHSGLGNNLGEVAKHLNDFINKKIRSISIHANIIIPIYGSDAFQEQLISNSNQYLNTVSQAYATAVKIVYDHPKETPYSEEEYNSLKKQTRIILQLLQQPLNTQLTELLDQLDKEATEKNLIKLARFLIEIAENDQVVLISAQELKRLSVESLKNPKQKLITGHDTQNNPWLFFQPDLASLSSLLNHFMMTLRDEKREMSSLLMQFIKKMTEELGMASLFHIKPSRLNLYPIFRSNFLN